MDTCLSFFISSPITGAYPEISKEGPHFKTWTVETFLVGQAFLLVSAYAGLRLPISLYISPFNTLIFFILVYLDFNNFLRLLSTAF